MDFIRENNCNTFIDIEKKRKWFPLNTRMNVESGVEQMGKRTGICFNWEIYLSLWWNSDGRLTRFKKDYYIFFSGAVLKRKEEDMEINLTC